MDTPTPPAKRYYWEDFGVGRVMTLGSKTVERDETLAFAQQFDPQPFHLDDAAAEASLFKQLSASGWHTCAMTMRLMCDGYLNDSASLGSPGIDELRWLKPVYPGDTISGRDDRAGGSRDEQQAARRAGAVALAGVQPGRRGRDDDAGLGHVRRAPPGAPGRCIASR